MLSIDVKYFDEKNCNTLINLTKEMNKTKIDLREYDKYIIINLNLNILTNHLDQT